ncbi:MAG: hypothetical protein DI551_02610 [Micavibrio aeruginosavorus]|uniref:Uncharacterized protein n=1 Tax=Micavibrio aeruginosavorus TaxID=349221 RepID=A0A2W5PZE3_9BACT|nr:MAG: hypothetical protein DI551_02610 [Micavibrio aeruginosavorus]
MHPVFRKAVQALYVEGVRAKFLFTLATSTLNKREACDGANEFNERMKRFFKTLDNEYSSSVMLYHRDMLDADQKLGGTPVSWTGYMERMQAIMPDLLERAASNPDPEESKSMSRIAFSAGVFAKWYNAQDDRLKKLIDATEGEANFRVYAQAAYQHSVGRYLLKDGRLPPLRPS